MSEAMFDPPLYTRSFKELTEDLRDAAKHLAHSRDKKLVPALKRFGMVLTAWDAARPHENRSS